MSGCFADCIEFYDDFGMGDHVKLKTYYRMCDELDKSDESGHRIDGY